MGTPSFAVPSLEALYHSGHEIIAVYSQPPRPAGRGQKETPSPIHTLALSHGTPVYTPVSLKDPQTQAKFTAHKADVAIVAAYGLLLPQAILDAYPHGCINVHPSLLPRWRGAAPIQRTVMAGDKMTGICIMQMNAGLDTGDVLLMEKYVVDAAENSGALHDRLAFAAGPLLLRTLDGLSSITPQKQSEEGVTYAKKITKEECHIDWNNSAEHIHNQIRGLSPSPGAYFIYNGESIKIFQSSFSAAGNGIPGTIMDDSLAIACKSGILQALEVQRPNKKRMTVGELLKGYAIPIGSIVS